MLNSGSQRRACNGTYKPDTDDLYQIDEERFISLHPQTAHNGNGSYLFAHVNMYGAGHAYAAQQQRDETHQGQEIGEVSKGAPGILLTGFNGFITQLQLIHFG